MARFTQSGSGDGAAGPQGPQGPAGADGADALWNFIGEYDNGADYYPGDLVTYNGGTYYRVGEPNPGYPPGTSYWATIAEPGEVGPQGEPGVSGATAVLSHEIKAGEAMSKGQAVYVSSADGTNMIVSKASNISETTSSKTMGLITTDLAHNGQGSVITEGLLTNLNTASANAGDPVWLGTDGNLIYGLANKPVAPEHLVFIGIVTRSNANTGEIFVKVQNGFELNELHTVLLESNGSLGDNEVLAFDSASGLWKNQTASEAGLATSGAFNYAQTIGTKVSNVNAGGVTIISTSITTNGYPVHVIVTGDADPISSGGWLRLQLYRDSTAIGNVIQCESSAAGENTPYALQIIDTPSAGTYTYSLKTTTVAGSAFNFGEVDGPVMCIMELGK
jgi:hypothetical protein